MDSQVGSRVIRTLLSRHPLTAVGAAVIALLGLVCGTFGRPLLDHAWGPGLAYGPEVLATGHWWTLLTGAPFAISPWCYLPVLASFIGFVGLCEHLLGTGRTLTIWGYGHVVGLLGATMAIVLLGDAQLRAALDAGPSGGALAAGAVASALLAPPWRRALRVGLIGYVLASIVLIGHFADVVHLIAVTAALPLGALIARRGAPAPNPAGRAAAVGLLRQYGGGTMSWMTTWAGLRYLPAPDGSGYVAYRQHLGVALALGDPVGSQAWTSQAPAAFAKHCRSRRLVPAWMAVSTATAELIGPRRVQIAEDNLLDLATLEFRGKRWQDVRTARNRAVKEGIECRLLSLADADPALVRQVRQISEAWLHDQRTPELGFTLGGVAEALDPRVRVAIAVDTAGQVHGVTSWLPVHGPDGTVRGWTLDMMRRRHDGFRPTIEFLIAEACLAFRAEGAELVSLSGAPLIRSGSAPVGRLQRGLDRAAGLMEPLYGFASLHAFKAKFAPRPVPLHLAWTRAHHLPLIVLALLVAFVVKPRPLPASVPATSHPVSAGRTGVRAGELAGVR